MEDREVASQTFNFVDPPIRDVITTFPSSNAWFEAPGEPGTGCGWAAVRVILDNPGIWPIHCHILPHQVMGMGCLLLESLDRLPPLPVEFNFPL